MQLGINDMRAALKERQFEVDYQPKYDLKNEIVAGAEALVRWRLPGGERISPSAFIPRFEQEGLVSQLDRCVWERVCQDLRSWMDKGYPQIAVSVNVARADVDDPELGDILLGLLAQYRLPIRSLHLEIEESVYLADPARVRHVVNSLRKRGFVIEMDDFGDGCYSLEALAEMPADVLKLGIDFIQNEKESSYQRELLSFVVGLARWLNLAVIAKGVETGEQIAALRSSKCSYVQGFYYARPMPHEAFEALLKSSKTAEMICASPTVRQYVAETLPHAPARSGREILVVDDLALNRAVLAGTFDAEYDVIERENGSTAWAYLEEHYMDVDAVLMDLQMPVMDGFQLLEKIRGDERTKELPVIVTFQGDAESERQALQIKADDFISRPYSPDIIKGRVRNAIAGRQLFRITHDVRQDDKGYFSSVRKAFALVESLKPHFDIVRLVEPEHTLVCRSDLPEGCEIHACFAVWGKATRCSNCISLRALREKRRCCKLEYSEGGLYFVISEYVPFGDEGAVVEMVTKLEDDYVDNVFDKKMLYVKLDKIHQQLDMDPLTSVYNRRYIDAHLNGFLDEARKEHSSLGIAMVDLDAFKRLNDTCGHLTGDRVLKSVAQMLADHISIHRGDFVARFGGDEFLVVCRGVSLPVLETRMEEVASLVRHIKADDQGHISAGISFGCVTTGEFPCMTAVELLEQADKRLYKAKERKRGGDSKE